MDTLTPAQVWRLRQALDMTQLEFALQVGVDRVSVGRWEAGTHRPRWVYVRAMRELQAKYRITLGPQRSAA